MLSMLAQLGLVLLFCRVVGGLFVRVGQPRVIGEMVAGIVLGPSVFGLLAPGLFEAVFPPGSLGALSALSQVGVTLFLFLVGLELDPALLRKRGHAAVVISHVGIVLPFLLGAALALYLYPRLYQDAPAMRFAAVALFLGAAMAVTAFPVLARILIERNLHATPVGAIAITCAAVDDVSAWCLLAVVVAIARAEGLSSALLTGGLTLLYVAAMVRFVRPLLARVEARWRRDEKVRADLFALVLVLVLASACATEAIGIHALFGAFLLGALMPKTPGFVRELAERLESLVTIFLLPLFFARTGLGTQIGLLDRPELWGLCALVVLVAAAGKLGGSAVAARACGLSWRDAGAIGVLMNTRGLMELVILDVGRELGVVSDVVFAMMVIMAVVTTAATAPLLSLVLPARPIAAEPRAPARPRPGGVLIPVSRPGGAGPFLALARLLAGPAEESRRLVALHVEQPEERAAYRAALADTAARAEPERGDALSPILAAARAAGVELEPLSLVASDVGDAINAAAGSRASDLVLLRSHQPLFGEGPLAGTVGRVLAHAPCDVAVLVDKGLGEVRRVLVPWLGGSHDALALELCRRIVRSTRADVTILHVVAPGRDARARPLGARAAAADVLEEGRGTVRFEVVEDDSPIDAALRASAGHDLVVVGLGEGFGLGTRPWTLRRERLVRECPISLVVARRAEEPVAEAAERRSPGPATA